MARNVARGYTNRLLFVYGRRNLCTHTNQEHRNASADRDIAFATDGDIAVDLTSPLGSSGCFSDRVAAQQTSSPSSMTFGGFDCSAWHGVLTHATDRG